MTGLITVKALKCERCGHVWLPKDPKHLSPQACGHCKSKSWNKPIDNKSQKHGLKFEKNHMSKRKVIAASMIGLIALVMMFSSPIMAMAAKDSAAASSSTSSNSGGDSKGGSSGDSKASDSSTSSSSSGSTDTGTHVKHPPKSIVPNPNDDGFTKKDGPQPVFPRFPGDDGSGRNFCEITHRCIPHFPHFPDRHSHDHVKVIERTVVVHDKANNPQTIVIQSNTAGQCIVTQQQITDSKDLLQTLLDTCVSLTILQQ